MTKLHKKKSEILVSKFYQKAALNGLTGSDVHHIRRHIEMAKQSQDDVTVTELKFLREEACKQGIFNKYSYENIEYIKWKTSLLPIVFAHNEGAEIKACSDHNYYFSCQFHNDETRSMKVSDTRNLFICPDCSHTGNVISYIMALYGYDFIRAIELIASVFQIKLPNNPFDCSPQQQFIINKILSDEYTMLISNAHLNGLERGIKPGGDAIYKRHLSEIHRLENGLPDDKFVYQKRPDRVYIGRKPSAEEA